MIAPAMNTRPQETLLYRDLARQQAQISRQIGLEALPRLKELLADVQDVDLPQDPAREGADEMATAFDVALRFGTSDQGSCRVEGELTGAVLLSCHRCAEVLSHPLEATFSCLIAESEAIANSLIEKGRAGGDSVPAEDVLVADGSVVTVAQIVEDEILLNLPERLCTSEPCERAPELAYPADSGLESAATGETESGSESAGDDASGREDNPFSVLADLKFDQSPKD